MFIDDIRSSIGGEERPKQDFAQLLEEIVVSASAKSILAEAAASILTLDGRIPAADAAAPPRRSRRSARSIRTSREAHDWILDPRRTAREALTAGATPD